MAIIPDVPSVVNIDPNLLRLIPLEFLHTPLDNFKSLVSNFAKSSKYLVMITSPLGGSEVINMSCNAVSGLGRSFGTYTTRQGESVARKLPNDEIYPDVTLTFYNTMINNSLSVQNFWENWMLLIKDGRGYGYYDDYTGVVDILQYDDNATLIKQYKLTNFYPTAVLPDAFSYNATDTLHNITITGSWW